MPRLLTLVLLALALTTGCLAAGGEDPCAGGGVLFGDDFADADACGWVRYNQGGAVVAIEDGMLRLTTSQPGQVWWTNPGRDFEDVIVTVQARQLAGPDDNAFGVICRYQNEQNFYIFLISGDGYYAIGKYQSGQPDIEYLTGGGEYLFSDIINQGEATNQIRASCQGDQLSLSVNGLLLDNVRDSSFIIGDVGLAASTFQPGTTSVSFDNLQVLAP